jgi:arsenate reductase-like glutaredoxin family protein
MAKVDLYYMRPGCVSCKKASELLDAGKAVIAKQRQSKKEPLSDADAEALLKSVSKVIVARGKSTETLKAADATLDHLRGPTGGFRAPMVKVGKTLLVGFHADALKDLVGA